MMTTSRRQFLTKVGQGMLVASVGPTMAANLGVGRGFAGEGSDALTFGSREPLVTLMQETPADKLLPILVGKLNAGLELRELVAAAALANARTFGGHNYDGYHAFMALAPAYQMAQEMPTERKALPVLKVIHRNTRFMQAVGGHATEALHAIEPAKLPSGKIDEDKLRQATREADAAAPRKSWPQSVRDRSRMPTTSCSFASRTTSMCIASFLLAVLGDSRPHGPRRRPHVAATIGAVLRR